MSLRAHVNFLNKFTVLTKRLPRKMFI